MTATVRRSVRLLAATGIAIAAPLGVTTPPALGVTAARTAASEVVTIPGNPPSTAANVHVGTPSSMITSQLLTSSPPVDEVWNWDASNPSAYPTIYKGSYFPSDRQPDTRFNAAAEPLSWFEANHPDWLEFTCAAASVSESQAIANGDIAYEFSHTTLIPLDITNPAVLSWEEQRFWGPAAASGAYQHLDFDNFQEGNGGSWSGQRCGHYSTTGTWTQQFNGTSNDPNYRAAETTLAQNLQTWLHATYPGIALAVNLSWCDCYLSDELNLLSHVDLWFDEQGMTAGNNGATGYYGQAWQDKVAAVESVVDAGHGWQDINQEPVSFTNTTVAQRQWALANYLLLKNSASWIYICGEGEYHSLLIAPEYADAQVGTPTDSYYSYDGVYRRDFTTGVTFVNSSSTATYTVTIPANTYENLYGNVQPGTVTLVPGSGLVLVDAPFGTVVGAPSVVQPSVGQTASPAASAAAAPLTVHRSSRRRKCSRRRSHGRRRRCARITSKRRTHRRRRNRRS